MKRIIIGLLLGSIIGIAISSYFVTDYSFDKIIYTKITLSSIVTGLLCGIYANYSKNELNLVIGSLAIGAAVFYIKYLVTGHDMSPLNMGTCTGAIIGFVFYIMEKITPKNRDMYRI